MFLLLFSDQIINVESHRLKGLGVGKCYTEYVPPPTAPEQVRSGPTPSTTPGLSHSRSTLRHSVMPSPMSNCQSATPTRQQTDIERSALKNSQSSTINQLTKIYTARQKYSYKDRIKDELENKMMNSPVQRNAVHQPAYLKSPVLFSQGYYESRGQGYNDEKGKGQNEDKDKFDLKKEEFDDNDGYSSYQNVRNGYHLHHGEYNK